LRDVERTHVFFKRLYYDRELPGLRVGSSNQVIGKIKAGHHVCQGWLGALKHVLRNDRSEKVYC
jgi:hypothetical protein